MPELTNTLRLMVYYELLHRAKDLGDYAGTRYIQGRITELTNKQARISGNDRRKETLDT